MKYIVSLLALVFIGFSPDAAAQLATRDLHVGLGLGTRFAAGVPLNASIDFPVTDEITAGGFVGYQRFSSGVPGFKASYNVLIFAARGTYHFEVGGPAELDPYGGAMLGYNVVNVKVDGLEAFGVPGFGTAASGVAYGFFVGANYNFSERFGAYAELGYGISILNLGLNVNL